MSNFPTGRLALGLLVLLGITGLLVVACQPAPTGGATPPAATIRPGATATTRPVTPTSTVSASRPVTWTVRLVTNPATGQVEGVVDDPRVYEMVKADYLEGEEWFITNASTLTRSSTAAQQLETYFAGRRHGQMVGLLDRWRATGQALTSRGEGRRIEVRNFTPDGQEEGW